MHIMSKPVESKLEVYLKSVGLQFHPFDQLQASADPRLKSYIIGHEVADRAWESGDCLIAGESGSGRTAITEKLLDECRIGTDNKEIFPICLREGDLTSDSIQDRAIRATAVEALLELAYQPGKFEVLSDKDRTDLVGSIESAAPGILDYFLPKILREGSHLPIVKFADLPAETLPNYPDQSRARKVAKQMQKLSQPEKLIGRSSPSILDIIPGIFGLKEIKLIADFSAAPDQKQLAELDGLRDRLSQRSSVSKVILAPAKPESGGQETILINWYSDQLINVLESRLRAASGGDFNSFNAISDPGSRYIEEEIVEEAADRGHFTPRAVLSLARTLLELQAQSGKILMSSDIFQQAVEKEFPSSV